MARVVNLLPIGQQGYESGTTVGSYYVVTGSANCTISSSLISFEGARALRYTSTVAGLMEAGTLQTGSLAPVTGGATYGVGVYARNVLSTSSTSSYLVIYWWKDTIGTPASTASAVSADLGNLSTTYAPRATIFVAPADAVYASLSLRTNAGAAGAVVYADLFTVTLYSDATATGQSLPFTGAIVSDPLGNTDSLAKTAAPTASDQSGSTDAIALAPQVVVGENTGTTDTPPIAYSIVASEVSTQSDSVANAVSRTAADDSGSTDALLKQWMLVASEQSGTVDGSAVELSAVRSDDLGSTDILVKQPSLVQGDDSGVTDAPPLSYNLVAFEVSTQSDVLLSVIQKLVTLPVDSTGVFDGIDFYLDRWAARNTRTTASGTAGSSRSTGASGLSSGGGNGGTADATGSAGVSSAAGVAGMSTVS